LAWGAFARRVTALNFLRLSALAIVRGAQLATFATGFSLTRLLGGLWLVAAAVPFVDVRLDRLVDLVDLVGLGYTRACDAVLVAWAWRIAIALF
jgi:hypothetical protein